MRKLASVILMVAVIVLCLVVYVGVGPIVKERVHAWRTQPVPQQPAELHPAPIALLHHAAEQQRDNPGGELLRMVAERFGVLAAAEDEHARVRAELAHVASDLTSLTDSSTPAARQLEIGHPVHVVLPSGPVVGILIEPASHVDDGPVLGVGQPAGAVRIAVAVAAVGPTVRLGTSVPPRRRLGCGGPAVTVDLVIEQLIAEVEELVGRLGDGGRIVDRVGRQLDVEVD